MKYFGKELGNQNYCSLNYITPSFVILENLFDFHDMLQNEYLTLKSDVTEIKF